MVNAITSIRTVSLSHSPAMLTGINLIWNSGCEVKDRQHRPTLDFNRLRAQSTLFQLTFVRSIFWNSLFINVLEFTRLMHLLRAFSRNTIVLMKVLHCKTKFKPITTGRQFHSTESWHRAPAGNTVWLVDWNIPSAIWKVSLRFQASWKEEINVSLVHYCTVF